MRAAHDSTRYQRLRDGDAVDDRDVKLSARTCGKMRAEGPYQGECQPALMYSGLSAAADLSRSVALLVGVLRVGRRRACTENAWPPR